MQYLRHIPSYLTPLQTICVQLIYVYIQYIHIHVQISNTFIYIYTKVYFCMSDDVCIDFIYI